MTAIFLAFITDLWIGDPVYSFHPVRLMGKMIEWLESTLRQIIKNNYLAGLILAVMFPLGVFAISFGIIYQCAKIHFALAWFVNFLGIYTAISIHDLKKESTQIQHDLHNNDLTQARTHLSRIVGRDTQNLDEKQIARATVEAVAESTVDGIVSPLFYACLGGAPLALAYKAINTLDSMVGHLNEQYKEFGYFSAKIDDVINWLPARLSYGIICVATFLTRLNVKSALMTGAKEIKVLGSISSLPEATFAGALQVRLGGTNIYEGRIEKKTFLGVESLSVGPNVIKRSITLMITSSWVALAFCLLIRYLIYLT